MNYKIVPIIICIILIILNYKLQFKYSNGIENVIWFVLVIWYVIVDINYVVIVVVLYILKYIINKIVFKNEGFKNNKEIVEFIIDKPTQKITTNKKYTALIVEPREHKALEFVLTNFMENLNDDWEFIIFHSITNKKFVENIMNNSLAKYKNKTTLINLNVDNDNFTIKHYSTMFYHKNFYEYIPTETFLVFQTDSMILPKNKNKIYKFLKYDYVGAPWKETDGLLIDKSTSVGNGGLSLRKKSKMLKMLKYKKLAIDKLAISNNYFGKYIAEDRFFNGYKDNIRKVINLKLPTLEEARDFSVEGIYNNNPFGIHKFWIHLDVTDKNNLLKKYPYIQNLIDLQN
jgi:hypothetical protein